MDKYITKGLKEQNKTAEDWLYLAWAISVDYDGYRTQEKLMGLIDEMAAYINEARKLLKERRGEWIGIQYDGYADGEPVYDEYECSACGAEYPNTHNFCPNCGAKMEDEE